MTQPITHDEMCASRKGRACNCGADKQPIAHAPECAGCAKLRELLRTAYALIIDHHNGSVRVEPGEICPHCAGKDGGSPKLDAIWDAINKAPPPDAAMPDMATLRAQLARAITERDEARRACKQAEDTWDDVHRELLSWMNAAKEGLAKGAAIQHPGGIQQLPADEGAIRSIVDAIENEHKHTERLLGLFSCPTVNATLSDAKERMKALAGVLERLANPPIFMPRET